MSSLKKRKNIQGRSYQHQIFNIAHPLMQKLIGQAIEVRKFRTIYPVLFDILKSLRKRVKEYLSDQLKEPIQRHFKFENDEDITKQINIILNDRRFVDQALGYVQNGKIYLHDEFLVKNILSKEQLNDLFDGIGVAFWEKLIPDYVKSLTPDERDSKKYIEVLKSVLNSNGWYLPNLIPVWEIEDLFVDYTAILLKYDKYKENDHDTSCQILDSNKRKQYPTYTETKECLEKLFLYDQPLLNSKNAFIDFHTEKNGNRSSNCFGVNVNLDYSPQHLPQILSDFLMSYSARRIDFYRGGEEGNLNEGHNLQQSSKVMNQLIGIMDGFTNKNLGLQQYITITSALLALLYFDGVFSQFSKESLKELEDLNCLEMIRHSNHIAMPEPQVLENIKKEDAHREKLLASLKPYSIDDLVKKILELFRENEEVSAELKIESGKKPTHIVFSIKHEKLSYALSIKGLKSKIKGMLEHFFLSEEVKGLNEQDKNSLGLSPIFTPLFQVIK